MNHLRVRKVLRRNIRCASTTGPFWWVPVFQSSDCPKISVSCWLKTTNWDCRLVLILFRRWWFTRSCCGPSLFLIVLSTSIYHLASGWLSCSHEGNMRYLHIPKFILCYICMKPLLLLRSYCKLCSHKSHKSVNATMYSNFLSPALNETR